MASIGSAAGGADAGLVDDRGHAADQAHHLARLDAGAQRPGLPGALEHLVVGGHEHLALAVDRGRRVVHRGHHLGGRAVVDADVLDELAEPGGQRVTRRQVGERDLLAVGVDPVGPVAHHRVDQRVAGREVPVERARTHPGALRDLVERALGAALAEHLAGGQHDLVVVALGIGPERPRGRLGRRLGRLLGRHVRTTPLINGDSLRIVLSRTGGTLRSVYVKDKEHSMTQQVDRAGRRTTVGLALILSVQLMLILDMTVVNVALPEIATDLGFTPRPSPGCSTPTRSRSVGCCCSAAASATCSAAAHVRRRPLRLHPRLPARRPGPHPRAAGGGALAAGRRRRRRRTERAGAPDQHRPGRGARNRPLGLFSAVSSAGGSIGLILGGALTGYASWRWSLFINVPIGLLVLVLVPRFVDETPRQPGRFDVTGAVTATLGSASLVFGSSTRPTTAGPRSARSARSRSPWCCSPLSSPTSAASRPRCSRWTCCAAGCAWARSR